MKLLSSQYVKGNNDMSKSATSQTIEQIQTLRQSPQQILLGQLLEMSSIELEEKVHNELVENPALAPTGETETTDYGEQEERNDADNDMGLDRIDDDIASPRTETAEEMQKNDYRSDDDIPNYRYEANNSSADDEYYIPEAVNQKSLTDYLEEQLAECDLTDKQQSIAEYIIGSIEDSGYMTRSLNEISDDLILKENIDASVDEINEVFAKIRNLDPAGIGATDLRDCLLLQLERAKATAANQLAYCIVDEHFDAFSKKHFDKIIDALHITRTELDEAMHAIAQLNPKPGNEFTGDVADTAQHITPDFRVEVDDDNHIQVTLLNRVPELQVEDYFKAQYGKITEQKPTSRRERELNRFLIDKYESATAFINALKQRQQTLFSIGQAIVRWQSNFFLSEDEIDIRPMALRDIAQITGYDQSVVSRATAKKYVETATRIYPMKKFFVSRISNDSGEDVSSREVQITLKEIIDNENKKKPYSDEQLVKMLSERGYDIARRTVAKYRDRMQIPVARLRKEL